MSDLLPHNATPQEAALEAATARIGNVPVRVRDVWDPAACPSHVLPWLAWSLSVDQWNSNWSDEQKRAPIASAIEVQQIKGTIGAVRAGLSALAIAPRVLEWHRQQVPGPEYTYKLLFDADFGSPVASLEQIRDAINSVDRTKSLRSHMETVEISTSSDAGPYLAAAALMGNEIVVYAPGPEALPVTTAELRAAGSSVPATGGDESFAVTDGDVTYTFAYSPFNIDTSAVNDMSYLFALTDFNGNIQYWNTSSVTTMRSMFSNSSFNQPLNAWDVGNVTDMEVMFYNAPFNQPLDAWDVSSVTNMRGMFWESSFNQPLDSWDVSSVTNMNIMFANATSFSPENYARTLIGWANRADNGGLDNGLQIGVTFSGSPNGYSTATYADAWPNVPGQRFTDAAAARAYLVAVMGWTVFDGGPV